MTKKKKKTTTTTTTTNGKKPGSNIPDAYGCKKFNKTLANHIQKHIKKKFTMIKWDLLFRGKDDSTYKSIAIYHINRMKEKSNDHFNRCRKKRLVKLTSIHDQKKKNLLTH